MSRDHVQIPRPRKRRYWRLSAVLLTAVLIWSGFDLFGSRRSDLREFDPETVARLETDMWRAYYDRQQVRLFFKLGESLRSQYHVPFLRSNVMAFYAAKAAFVFKDGKARKDYELALPDLVRYYNMIRGISATPFDVNQAARLELEWWIIHRERDRYPRSALDLSLAELQALLYAMPVERFMEHGRLRAEAMLIRDRRSESGGVSDSDWESIHQLLRQSWLDLWNQVRPSPGVSSVF